MAAYGTNEITNTDVQRVRDDILFEISLLKDSIKQIKDRDENGELCKAFDRGLRLGHELAEKKLHRILRSVDFWLKGHQYKS